MELLKEDRNFISLRSEITLVNLDIPPYKGDQILLVTFHDKVHVHVSAHLIK